MLKKLLNCSTISSKETLVCLSELGITKAKSSVRQYYKRGRLYNSA